MFEADILAYGFRNKLLPEPVAFLFQALITHAEDRSPGGGEFDNPAVIDKSGIIIVV